MLRTLAVLALPFLILLALHLLLEGHDEPGGGFIGGVLMASAIALQFIGRSIVDAPRALQLPYPLIMSVGLLLSMGTGMVALLTGVPYLTMFYIEFPLPGTDEFLRLSLALVFDIGIFLLIVGGLLTVVLALAED